MARALEVQVVGDTRRYEQSLQRAARSTQRFNRQVEQTGRHSRAFQGLTKSVTGFAAAFVGTAGVINVLKTSVEASSNLAEQTTKTDAVFGKSAAGVEKWAQTSVRGMGQASDQALETASSFGALLRPIGVSGQAAADQSRKLTELGADLASFYNTDVQSALDAIRSGLVGESEPLRKYGVQLNEARVKALAMADSGKSVESQLTTQEKALARIKIIYQDTTLAQGDFAKTSGGLANQQRILTAGVRELQIQIGNALRPVILNIVERLNDWIGKTENQKRVTDAVKEAVRTATGVFNLMRDALDRVNQITGSTKETLKLLLAVLAAFKAAKILSALANVATGIRGIGTQAETATGKVRNLRGLLLGLSGLVITVAIELELHRAGVEEWLKSNLGPVGKALAYHPFGPDIAAQQRQAAQAAGVAAQSKLLNRPVKLPQNLFGPTTGPFAAKPLGGPTLGPGGLAPARVRPRGFRTVAPAETVQTAEVVARAAKAAGVAADKATAATNAAAEKASKLREAREKAARQLADDLQKYKQQEKNIRDRTRDFIKATNERFREQQKQARELARLTRFHRPVSSRALLEALHLDGLSPRQRRRIRAGFDVVSRGGTLPAGRSLAFAGAGGGIHVGTLNVHNTHNIGDLEQQLTKRQGGRPHNRRGPR